MHIRWVDRTIFNATSAGLGDFVVASAVTGYLTPAQSSAIDGEEYHYAAQILDGSGNITAWEVGTGAYTAGTTTLARTTIEFSSNSNNKVNFATAPQVMLTALAQDFELELDADTSFYVSTTGNDSNTGLSPSQAWATLQHALDVVSNIELNGFAAQIAIANGTYEGVLLKKPNPSGFIWFLGNPITPSGIIITPSSLSVDKACFDIEYETNLILTGFVCTGTGIANGERGISVRDCLANVELQTVSFTNLANPIYGAFGPTIVAAGAVNITGNAVNVIWLEQAVFRSHTTGSPPSLTFTIVGTPAWTDCFISVDDQGLFDNPGQATFTGGATGKRFRVQNGGVIQTLTNNLSYFPGNVVGDILAGGQYDVYGIREILIANRTYYVSTTGSNTNNGLAVGTPFATLQYAFNLIVSRLDLAGFTVTIQMADGAYTLPNGSLDNTGIGSWIGSGTVVIQGNLANQALVTIDGTAGASTIINITQEIVGTLEVKFLTLIQPAGTFAVVAGSTAFLKFTNVNTQGGGGVYVASSGGALIWVLGDFSHTGNVDTYIDVFFGGQIGFYPNTFTLVGTPAFAYAFARAHEIGHIDWFVTTAVVGTATGRQYIAYYDGIINTYGQTIPGNAAGFAYAGGTFVGVESCTVANLPVSWTLDSIPAGDRQFVTDATLSLVVGLGTIVAGGGSNKTPVHNDGTNWIIG